MLNPFLPNEVIVKTVDALRPGILELLKLYGRDYLHCFITLDCGEKTEVESVLDFALGAKNNVNEYPKPYNEIALRKAHLSARTRMNTADVVTRAPQLLRGADVIWQGGVYLDGIVVATSGAPAPVDEAIAMMIAVSLRAHCQVEVSKLQAAVLAGKGSSFVPVANPS